MNKNKLECGCVEISNTTNNCIWRTTELCAKHQADRDKDVEESKIKSAERMEEQIQKYSTELTCDKCGRVLCLAYENDLEGSRFYCIEHKQ